MYSCMYTICNLQKLNQQQLKLIIKYNNCMGCRCCSVSMVKMLPIHSHVIVVVIEQYTAGISTFNNQGYPVSNAQLGTGYLSP